MPNSTNTYKESAGTTPPNSQTTTHHSRRQFSSERKEDYDRVSNNARSPTFKRTVGSSRHLPTAPGHQSNSHVKESTDMSFVVLSESQVFPPAEPPQAVKSSPNQRKLSHRANGQSGEDDSLSTRMETASRIFEILSARSDIDHPICVECTERLVEQLQKRLSNASRERDAYVDFLRQANSDIPTDEELQQARQDLKRIQEKERAAFAELQQLEKEKAAIEAEILDLDAQSYALDQKEESFWAERNAFSQKLSSLQSERDCVNNQYDHDSRQLERLRRANVYNDVFSIGHDGFFGTINGLRLGRLPDRPVDWSEINAAWGDTCLLVATVAEKLNYVFKGYELFPMGSSSRIRQYKAPRGGLFPSDFDTAMIAFLECLRQLILHAEHTPFQLPDGSTIDCPRIAYKIEKDKIGDNSIKLSGLGKQEESFTKACKLTLICCKFLLAHASTVNESRRRG